MMVGGGGVGMLTLPVCGEVGESISPPTLQSVAPHTVIPRPPHAMAGRTHLSLLLLLACLASLSLAHPRCWAETEQCYKKMSLLCQALSLGLASLVEGGKMD